MSICKIIIVVPVTHQNEVRDALAKAGAGIMGNYEYCFFTTAPGIGMFRPLEGADPAIGQVGKLEEVVEVRIHTFCEPEKLEKVIEEVKKVHPYEEIPFEVYKMDDYPFISKK